MEVDLIKLKKALEILEAKRVNQLIEMVENDEDISYEETVMMKNYYEHHKEEEEE